MTDIRWVRIISWHAVRRVVGLVHDTYCGRSVPNPDPSEVRDRLPGERSCETCLRLVAREQDR